MVWKSQRTAAMTQRRTQGGSAEQSLREHLKSTGWPDLFRELKNAKLPMELWLKHQCVIASVKEKERAMFFRAQSAMSNFLTFLHYKIGNFCEAKAENTELLQAMPDNLTARVIQVQLCLEARNLPEAKKLLRKLEAENPKQKEILEARLDIAYCLSCLAPRFYQSAIGEFESVISAGEGIVSDSLYVFALYHLSSLYSKLLSKSVRTEYSQSPACSVWHCITRVCRLLHLVIQSGDDVLAPRSWMDLGIAIQKLETVHRVSICLEWDESISSEICIDRSGVYNEETEADPYILEMAGRYVQGKGYIDEAVRLLNEAVKQAPHRHVAWHHLGLAYRQLWQQEVQGRQSGANNRRRGKCANSRPFKICVPTLPVVGYGRGLWAALTQPPSKQPDVCSKYQGKYANFPNWNKVDNPVVTNDSTNLFQAHDCFTQASQICRDSHCRYLVDLSRTKFSLGETSKALDCLQRADGLLATVRDEKCCHDVSSADAMYLYEQWGYQLSQHWEWQQQIDSIKYKFRLAIEHAVKAQTVPDIAYHALMEIIQSEQPKSRAHCELQALSIALRLAMRRTKAAGRKLDKSMQSNRALERDKRMLTCQVERMMQEGEYSAAYTYLTVLLCEHGTLPETLTMQTVLELAQKAAKRSSYASMIYKDIVGRFLPFATEEQEVVQAEEEEEEEEEEEDSNVPEHELPSNKRDSGYEIKGAAYDVELSCVPQRAGQQRSVSVESSDSGYTDDAASPQQPEKHDLVLLANDGRDLVTHRLYTYLTEHCGLKVFLAAMDQDTLATDIHPGTFSLDALDKCQTSQTRGVIVLAPDYRGRKNGTFQHAVDSLLQDVVEQPRAVQRHYQYQYQQQQQPSSRQHPPLTMLVDTDDTAGQLPPKWSTVRKVSVSTLLADDIHEDELAARLEQCTWNILHALILCSDDD